IRKFKFEETATLPSGAKPNGTSPDKKRKNPLTRVYVDFAGDALSRNFSNATGTGVYTDSSNRNDIVEISVTHNRKEIYFHIQTLAPVTSYNKKDLNWMNILINNKKGSESFAGYQFIINRKPGNKNVT